MCPRANHTDMPDDYATLACSTQHRLHGFRVDRKCVGSENERRRLTLYPCPLPDLVHAGNYRCGRDNVISSLVFLRHLSSVNFAMFCLSRGAPMHSHCQRLDHLYYLSMLGPYGCCLGERVLSSPWIQRLPHTPPQKGRKQKPCMIGSMIGLCFHELPKLASSPRNARLSTSFPRSDRSSLSV